MRTKKKLKILVASDIHGNFKTAKTLSEKAEREKVDLVILAGDIYGYTDGKAGILKPFKKKNQLVLFVPGNCEFERECLLLEKDAKNISGQSLAHGNVTFIGVGNPNGELHLTKKDFKRIEENFKQAKSTKKILISHLHARGTLAEFSGFFGDPLLRKAVENFQPNLLISGHIHEAEGLDDKIGKTQVIQIGKNGRILEI